MNTRMVGLQGERERRSVNCLHRRTTSAAVKGPLRISSDCRSSALALAPRRRYNSTPVESEQWPGSDGRRPGRRDARPSPVGRPLSRRPREKTANAKPLSWNGPVSRRRRPVAGVPPPARHVSVSDPAARPGGPLPRPRRPAPLLHGTGPVHFRGARGAPRGLHRDPPAQRRQTGHAAGGGQPRQQDDRLPAATPTSTSAARAATPTPTSSRSTWCCRASRRWSIRATACPTGTTPSP